MNPIKIESRQPTLQLHSNNNKNRIERREVEIDRGRVSQQKRYLSPSRAKHRTNKKVEANGERTKRKMSNKNNKIKII